jgi:hypothetical protein
MPQRIGFGRGRSGCHVPDLPLAAGEVKDLPV